MLASPPQRAARRTRFLLEWPRCHRVRRVALQRGLGRQWTRLAIPVAISRLWGVFHRPQGVQEGGLFRAAVLALPGGSAVRHSHCSRDRSCFLQRERSPQSDASLTRCRRAVQDGVISKEKSWEAIEQCGEQQSRHKPSCGSGRVSCAPVALRRCARCPLSSAARAAMLRSSHSLPAVGRWWGTSWQGRREP